jgi:aspartyl-tRNA(Asn)/glutamyl-tRNA(Gln) amidotransferase subunit A
VTGQLDTLTSMSATTLAGLVHQKVVSPVEVVEAALARIEALDPTLHAFCELTADHALQHAKEQADALARGEDIGPLGGVPIAIKDLIATAGVPTRCGSPAYRDFVPDEDDIVVERVRAAGAISLGKTTVPEFGYSGVGHNPVSPTARNPWDPDLTPGGSSSGSGVAVATGMTPLALGSDGGGSIRIPAAHCGIYGFKASMGRVPAYPGCRDERYPGISSWESLEHIGPMTRTVQDAALLMSVLAGPDPRDRHSLPACDVDWLTATTGGVAGLRIAFSADWGYLAVDPEVREIATRAAAVFAELGATVTHVDPGWKDPFDAFWALVVADTDLTGMRAMVAEHGEQMSPHLVEMLTQPWTAEQLTDGHTARKRLVNHMWRFMADYDLLLSPTLTVPPFPVGIQGPGLVDGQVVPDTAWLGFTSPINMTGQPAASLPAGFTTAGLPVGLQLVGAHLADATVLRASAAFEQAAPWAQLWPALVTG